MKRYLLFAYPICYPNGGWHDFQGSFDTHQEAVDHGQSLVGQMIERATDPIAYWHVVDLLTGAVINDWQATKR